MVKPAKHGVQMAEHAQLAQLVLCAPVPEGS